MGEAKRRKQNDPNWGKSFLSDTRNIFRVDEIDGSTVQVTNLELSAKGLGRMPKSLKDIQVHRALMDLVVKNSGSQCWCKTDEKLKIGDVVYGEFDFHPKDSFEKLVFPTLKVIEKLDSGDLSGSKLKDKHSLKFCETYWLSSFRRDFGDDVLALLNNFFVPICTANSVNSNDAYKVYAQHILSCRQIFFESDKRWQELLDEINDVIDKQDLNSAYSFGFSIVWRKFKGLKPEEDENLAQLKEFLTIERLKKAKELFRNDDFLSFSADTVLCIITPLLTPTFCESFKNLFEVAWMCTVVATILIVEQ